MTSTLIQMTLIMACGIGWRLFSPAGLSAEQSRKVLTNVVFYIFLPALILEVLWSAEIGAQSFNYTLIGVTGVLSGLLMIWSIASLLKVSRAQKGAILLATAFPNVTYLGLPVLEQTFGGWARSVAIQIDLFATSPLVYTAGIMVARYYGQDEEKHSPLFSFLFTPPFLAAMLAVLLNLNHIPAPAWLTGVLQRLSAAVVPLMLFSLGLALSWDCIKVKNIPYILPVIVIKLLIMPLCIIELVSVLVLADHYKAAAVVDMAMPSMVLGIIFCDRYRLDSSLYAMAVTITTLCSIFTLPYWYSQL